MTRSTTQDSFFRETNAYWPMLMRALERIVGEGEAGDVFQRLVRMEAVGAYIRDPGILHKLGAFLTGEQDDLGFYVVTMLEKGSALQVRDSGLIAPLGVRIETRPVFLSWDAAIERCAARDEGMGRRRRPISLRN